MKKQLLFAAFAVAAVTLTSCSSSEDILGPDLSQANQDANVPVLTIGVAGSGDNFTTRGASDPGRNLWSAEAKQNITKVKAIICSASLKAGKTAGSTDPDDYENFQLLGVKLFDNWNTTAKKVNGVDRVEEWKLLQTSGANIGKPIITPPNGSQVDPYIIFAVGYLDNTYSTGSTLSTIQESDNLPVGFWPHNLNTTKDPKYNGDLREIFAGSKVILVDKSGNVNEKVLLHRQVAGALGYFTKCPTHGDAFHSKAIGSKLRLVASSASTKMQLGKFNSSFEDKNSAKMYVNNSIANTAQADAAFYDKTTGNVSTTNDAYTVYEINIRDWFPETGATGTPNYGDYNSDGVWDVEDARDGTAATPAVEAWKKPDQLGTEGVTVRRGSMLAGQFVMPFGAIANKGTLQLQMIGKSYEADATDAEKEDHVIRAWNISLPSSATKTDDQIGQTPWACTMSTVNNLEVATWTQAATADTKDVFSLVRNHLYSIGVRKADKAKGGDTDPDPQPGDDEDDPSDLTKENLQTYVISAWEDDHNMNIQ